MVSILVSLLSINQTNHSSNTETHTTTTQEKSTKIVNPGTHGVAVELSELYQIKHRLHYCIFKFSRTRHCSYYHRKDFAFGKLPAHYWK